MFTSRRRTDWGSSGLWLMLAAIAAGLALSAPGARAQTGASLDIQAANNALTAEQLVAQFYNANSGKSYLTGVLPVTPVPATPSPVVNPAGGINQPGTSTGSTDGTPLSATLSGSGETP